MYQNRDGLLLTEKEIARLERRAEILRESLALREAGATLTEIGEKYGASRQSARQRFLAAGISTQRRTA